MRGRVVGCVAYHIPVLAQGRITYFVIPNCKANGLQFFSKLELFPIFFFLSSDTPLHPAGPLLVVPFDCEWILDPEVFRAVELLGLVARDWLPCKPPWFLYFAGPMKNHETKLRTDRLPVGYVIFLTAVAALLILSKLHYLSLPGL